ncbi:MAG: bifunctional phosphoribosyl-AMP cyclohydrolase/phosphoribosyl-ATP diphosphatase HisIE [Lachnospiraceae bacterium]|nr:bifunctional phosphoribosyl-AMP cyclohydrolase/phosphoribosyl-ATP diphosphatase HisIE [Lachnospiraceae bacterium]
MKKMLVPCIYMQNGKAVTGFGKTSALTDMPLDELAESYSVSGADALLVLDFSNTDEEHEEAIACLASMCRQSQVPVIAAGNIKRAEDVKKLLYAGARQVILNGSRKDNMQLLPEVSRRFGKEKLAVSIASVEEYMLFSEDIEAFASRILVLSDIEDSLPKLTSLPILFHAKESSAAEVLAFLAKPGIEGVTGSYVSSPDISLLKLKEAALGKDIPMAVFSSSLSFDELKTDEKGLIPCVVQDYSNDEVLMMAYMNRESFEKTLLTGKMHYYSRSRKCLWLKGESSGHYQYVKAMSADCDRDTLLAKVSQVGAACHTGNRSCFFTPLFDSGEIEKNPMRVFESVYNVILDRKANPREGSYTNYLFDKGIDKILKKVGEENTEIIIAAKNPDPQELRYEISDYLYHLMVLMAEKGVNWTDITDDLSRR